MSTQVIAQSTVERAWHVTAAFKSPESAVISEKHRSIFISNVNGYTKNGKGFISRLNSAGRVANVWWLTGLNAPTGLAVEGDTLWVVDFDALVKINIPSQEIIARYPAHDEQPLLNDVAIGTAGIFVTGSGSSTIYHLVGNQLRPFIKNDTLLKYANGIALKNQTLYVGGDKLVTIDIPSKQIRRLNTRPQLQDFESIALLESGQMILSLVGDHPAYLRTSDGQVAPLFNGESFVADFHFERGILVAPTASDTVAAYRIRGVR